MKRSSAFSLAEILLTLVIIGIVSSVALPTLRKTVGNKQYEAMMSKNYLNFKLAWETMVASNKGFMVNSYTDADSFVADLTGHKIYGKKCDPAHHCFTYPIKGVPPAGFEKVPPGGAIKLILDDGSVAAVNYFPACATTVGAFNNSCGQIWIDVNGTEKPNMYARDIYGFVLTRDTLEPADEDYVLKKS